MEKRKFFNGKIEKESFANKALSCEEIKIAWELLKRKEVERFVWINNTLYIFERRAEEREEDISIY